MFEPWFETTITELTDPDLLYAFGPDSTQVRNLDKRAARLRTPR